MEREEEQNLGLNFISEQELLIISLPAFEIMIDSKSEIFCFDDRRGNLEILDSDHFVYPVTYLFSCHNTNF